MRKLYNVVMFIGLVFFASETIAQVAVSKAYDWRDDALTQQKKAKKSAELAQLNYNTIIYSTPATTVNLTKSNSNEITYEKINYKSGATYVGETRNGIPYGKGTYNSSTGVKYVGDWRDDEYNGYGILTTDDYRYEGQFAGGAFNGNGILTTPVGYRYEGQFKNGKQDGHMVASYPDGRKYVGQYKNGRPNGYGTLTKADGTKVSGQFKDGKQVQ